MQNDLLLLALAAAMFPRSQTFEKCIPYRQIKQIWMFCSTRCPVSFSLAYLLCISTSEDIIAAVLTALPVTDSSLSIFIQSGLEIQVITKWITIYWTSVCIVFRLDTHKSWLTRPVLGTVWVCVQTVLHISDSPVCFTSIEPIFYGHLGAATLTYC